MNDKSKIQFAEIDHTGGQHLLSKPIVVMVGTYVHKLTASRKEKAVRNYQTFHRKPIRR